jgi:hypothetical protein
MTTMLSYLNVMKKRLNEDPIWFSRYVLLKTLLAIVLILAASAWFSRNVIYQAF